MQKICRKWKLRPREGNGEAGDRDFQNKDKLRNGLLGLFLQKIEQRIGDFLIDVILKGFIPDGH